MEQIAWNDRTYWKQLIPIEENGIHMLLGVTKKDQLKLLHFSSAAFDEESLVWTKQQEEGFQLVQLELAGCDRPYERHGNKYVVTGPGCRLQFDGLEKLENTQGSLYCIRQRDGETGILVESRLQFYNGIPIVRFTHTVSNEGTQDQVMTYLSSFSYAGLDKEGDKPADEKLKMLIPHNGWQKEMNWRWYTLPELGFPTTQTRSIRRSSKVIEVTNTGNWSTKEYLPMGYLENTQSHTGWIWQIEHNGSWHYEIADQNDHFLLNVSGPTEIQSHWSKVLHPGESFVSVPVAAGVCEDDINHAFAALTRYRRQIRRDNEDNRKLPVIFNDYMNCLWADPTTEKELPLIDAAAKAGCEYFVMDAGWYDIGVWWDSVGEWKECKERFPGGLRKVMDYVRSKGMIPGIWLELEVIGINSPKLADLTDDCFFVRHGKRVYDRSRYQLDFRNPKVIAHANEVIDRMVQEYRVGYIKMDYNIEPGIGTELGADSFGDGLLQHERAYLSWLDSVFERYPDLVIESCSSGGLRMDYALLSRCSLQSTSDQEEYEQYAMIAANAATGVTPEQAAVWSYPLETGDREEVIFNMVNALLLRIHQSGHLAKLTDERFHLVAEGIRCYKQIRGDIVKAIPYWPLGLAKWEDEWLCAGLKVQDADRYYLAVWKKKGQQETKRIPVVPAEDMTYRQEFEVKQIYPEEEKSCGTYDPSTGELEVRFEKPVMARLFKIRR